MSTGKIRERFLVKIWCGRNWMYRISYNLGLGNFHTSWSLDFLSNANLYMKVVTLLASYLSRINKGDLLVNQMSIFLYNLSSCYRNLCCPIYDKHMSLVTNDYAIVTQPDNKRLILFVQFLLIVYNNSLYWEYWTSSFILS